MVAVFSFEDYFRNADEVNCAAVSEDLAQLIPTSGLTREQYRDNLLKTKHDWIWHCLGLLMMAAIPIRRGVRIRRQRKIDLTIQLIPGKNNPGLQPLKIDHTEKPKTRAERYGQSKLYIPGRGEINTVLLEQTYHLQQVREVLKILGEERAFISRPWLLEIMRLHNRLESQRSEIKKEIPGHSLAWAQDWDFTLPDYDLEQVYWERSENRWRTRANN
ncbi:hypothetical protein ANO14919_128210 [Xylariales sp. No.14919]|nr:hypothetical protein ANO14919_128210 [Xylariales sp. No.14919]